VDFFYFRSRSAPTPPATALLSPVLVLLSLPNSAGSLQSSHLSCGLPLLPLPPDDCLPCQPSFHRFGSFILSKGRCLPFYPELSSVVVWNRKCAVWPWERWTLRGTVLNAARPKCRHLPTMFVLELSVLFCVLDMLHCWNFQSVNIAWCLLK